VAGDDVETAYDPVRIELLSTRTAQAVDELAAIRCSDPSAADALRAVRLLRTNLEDLWLPLLAQIRTSRAMITWLESTHDRVERGREMIVDWLEDHRRPPNEFADLSDDDLVMFITWIGVDALPFGDDGQLDMGDDFWSTSFTDFAEVVAERVGRDPEFADRILGLAARNPMVGLAAGFADYPPDYLDALARRMLFRPSFFDGFDVRAGAAAAEMVLTALTDEPVRCLALLHDPESLETLAGWPFLDADVVSSVFATGLYTAVQQDPRRLERGYEVLGSLTALAAHRMSDGFSPGAARGIANSLIGYIDTLAPALGKEDGGKVDVLVLGETPFTVELGTYEEVRDLIGAIGRDARAQTAIGVTLGAYVNSLADGLGVDIARRSGVEHVAQFADLVGDAVTAEQAEMVAAAAAASAQRRVLAGAVGFGVSAAASAAGGGPIVNFAVGQLVGIGADRFAHVDPDTMPNGVIRHTTYDAIVVATVTVGRAHPTMIDADQAADDPDELDRVDEYLDRLAELDAAGDTDGYAVEVSHMTQFIERSTPNLDSFVNSITELGAVNELIESHD
jgi:hypothetical protein